MWEISGCPVWWSGMRPVPPVADFVYVSHRIESGKYALEGLPCAHEEDGDAETLVITMRDFVTGLELDLYYGVFADQDIITRAARLRNNGTHTLRLEKAASLCLDLPFGQWDLIHFHGRHAMERQMQRTPLANAIQTVSSTRGASSHHHNPFVILCDRGATETAGLCYGVMLVYSGSHRTDIEVDQNGSTRIVSGIHDERFSWKLDPGAAFTTPEVLLACAPRRPDRPVPALSAVYPPQHLPQPLPLYPPPGAHQQLGGHLLPVHHRHHLPDRREGRQPGRGDDGAGRRLVRQAGRRQQRPGRLVRQREEAARRSGPAD